MSGTWYYETEQPPFSTDWMAPLVHKLRSGGNSRIHSALNIVLLSSYDPPVKARCCVTQRHSCQLAPRIGLDQAGLYQVVLR